MTTIAILGPEHSQSWQAAAQFAPAAAIRAYPHVRDLLAAFDAHLADYAILPVYNTREGEKKQSFRLFGQNLTRYHPNGKRGFIGRQRRSRTVKNPSARGLLMCNRQLVATA